MARSRTDRARVAVGVLRALAVADPGAMPTMLEVQALYARSVVEAHGGNKTRAAKALGISRRALYRWLARGEA